jgi:DNA-binding transcriptional LysR family regulator
MDLPQMQTLLMLADTGSMVETAKRLHYSPPAIHRRLKLMEEEIGIVLYERDRGRLRLTPGGHFLLPLIRQLYTRYEAVLHAASEWRGVQRGVVRLATGPTFCTYVLPSILREFRNTHPNVDVIVEAGHSDQLIQELNGGGLDLLFLLADAASSRGLKIEAEWEFDVVLVANAQQRLPKRCRLASLQDLPFILYREGSVFENLIDRYLAAHQFQPRVSMHLDNAEPIKALIRSGLGVAFLPEWTVAAELKSGELQRVPHREKPLRAKIAMFRQNTAYVPPGVLAFMELAQRNKLLARSYPRSAQIKSST